MSPIIVKALQRMPSASITFRSFEADGLRVSLAEAWTDLPITGPAKLAITAKMDGNRLAYTMKLTFTSCQTLKNTRRHNYLLTLNDGRQLLLAIPRRPYPVTSLTHTLPTSPKDSPLPEYTAEWTGELPPQPIIVDD